MVLMRTAVGDSGGADSGGGWSGDRWPVRIGRMGWMRYDNPGGTHIKS